MKMLVTQANEVLAKDGIHGRIASVGVGFGTGRHTAQALSNHTKRGCCAPIDNSNYATVPMQDTHYNIRIKSP